MKRSIAILLGLILAAGAGLAQAGRSGGSHGGGRAVAARPSGGFTHFTTGPMRFTTGPMRFTTGPMRFTTGQHPGRVIGVPPPGAIARPIPLPPPPIHSHPGFVGGGTVIVTAPFWYPPYPYPSYPYVVPTYGGPVAAGVPTYSDAPTYADEPAYSDTPGYSERNDYWYYCPDSQTYYPYVPTCPSPWMQVVPGDTGASPSQ